MPIRPLVVAPQIAKGDRQGPEGPGPRRVPQRRDGAAGDPAGGRGRRHDRGPPVRRQAQVAGSVAKEQRGQREHSQGRGGDQQRGDLPAGRLGQEGHHRQEDQLTRGAAGGEDAHHQPASLDEPGVGHGGGEDQGHRARAETDQDAPGQDQLPGRLGEDRQSGAGGDQDQSDAGDAAQPEALHQSRRERSGQPVEHQVDADRGRHGHDGPAEVLVQRDHQRPRRRPEGRRRDQGGESGARHHPPVVHPAHRTPPLGQWAEVRLASR